MVRTSVTSATGTYVMPALSYSVQASAIFSLGSPRPINVSANLDPFGLGYTGRWLDATGRTLPQQRDGLHNQLLSRTHLQPSSSTNLFYQPRQIQFGFRVSY